MSDTHRFDERMRGEWLTAYCSYPKRHYDSTGFDPSSLRVSEADARDCARAIDGGIVLDLGGGRYRAPRSSCDEVLFWQGHKKKSPRRITVWQEPVITFAALARLHYLHQWPKECLGTQSKDWAYDIVGFRASDEECPVLLGEVKKSAREIRALRDDLLALAKGTVRSSRSQNVLRKWDALLVSRPALLWLVGPREETYLYAPEYSGAGAKLHEVSESALHYSTVRMCGRPVHSPS